MGAGGKEAIAELARQEGFLSEESWPDILREIWFTRPSSSSRQFPSFPDSKPFEDDAGRKQVTALEAGT